jgi:acyl-CoA synthetase (NDP forming)
MSEVLQKLFGPKSIALIGASRDPKKLGHNTLKNLIEGGFRRYHESYRGKGL